jgi:hypothetical protein
VAPDSAAEFDTTVFMDKNYHGWAATPAHKLYAPDVHHPPTGLDPTSLQGTLQRLVTDPAYQVGAFRVLSHGWENR